MRAVLTLTVELGDIEAQVLRWASKGLTNEQIAAKFGGKFPLGALLKGLHLKNSIDLVEEIRAGNIECRFLDEEEPAGFTGSGY